MLNPNLEQLGFNQNEARVFLALAELGRSTPNALGKRVGLPRTTVYSVLDNLVQKGVASHIREKRQRYYIANHPSALFGLIETERTRLAQREHFTRSVVDQLLPMFRSHNLIAPRLQFFEGAANVRGLLTSHLERWHKSMRQYDNTLWGYQDHTFVLHYRSWLERYWREMDKHHQIKLFSNQAEVETNLRRKVPNREVRLLPVDFQFKTTIWISGDYITMIMSAEEPHYAFQIVDTLFANNLKLMFQLLWSLVQR